MSGVAFSTHGAVKSSFDASKLARLSKIFGENNNDMLLFDSSLRSMDRLFLYSMHNLGRWSWTKMSIKSAPLVITVQSETLLLLPAYCATHMFMEQPWTAQP